MVAQLSVSFVVCWFFFFISWAQHFAFLLLVLHTVFSPPFQRPGFTAKLSALGSLQAVKNGCTIFCKNIQQKGQFWELPCSVQKEKQRSFSPIRCITFPGAALVKNETPRIKVSCCNINILCLQRLLRDLRFTHFRLAGKRSH